MIPRLVIAGTNSGVGKTTFVVGLCAALRLRGLRVAVFKCGPDYLDPTYHARASGAPSQNLDGWMMGREGVLNTFLQSSQGYDIALIEGVMGLFDGANVDSDEGSSAEISKWLGAPVVLVVDASGMSRSVAAIANGFASFDSDVQLAGLICNRVGSRYHLDLLSQACHATPGLVTPVLGGLPKDNESSFPERHLGLHTADEEALPEQRIRAWADHVTNWCDLDRLIAIAGSATDLFWVQPSVSARASPIPVCRIGIAQDEAFHFYYGENLRLLEEAGAELVRFSPLGDKTLPSVDGLYFGGGYPELYAKALSENIEFRDEVRRFCSSGKPVYAECGGLMYLSAAIRTISGESFPMVSWFDAVAVMNDRLQALGYVEATLQKSSFLGRPDEVFRGHQFRYSTLEWQRPSDSLYHLRRKRNGEVLEEGYSRGNVIGSYVHAHWASNSQLAKNFVRACAKDVQPQLRDPQDAISAESRRPDRDRQGVPGPLPQESQPVE